MYRQGDVLIVPVEEIPGGATKVRRDRGRIVLAYGEVTGHAHVIASREAELLETADLQDRFLRVLAEGGVALRHEEHGTITLPRGEYVVRRQREYMPWGEWQVAD